MSLSFTIFAGPRQRIHSQVRVTFYGLRFETPPTLRPGPRIYIHQEQGGLVIHPGTEFPFRRFYDSQGYGGGDSNPLLHPGGPVCYPLTLSPTD
jgi:hypothetical protein